MKTKFILILGLLTVFAGQGSALAAIKGIGLSPAIQEVELSEGQASASFSVHLSNTTDETADLNISTLDFGALDESGGIAFLGQTGQETTSYGLKQWMSLEKDQLTLEPGQSQEIKVTIENKQSLSPGGHYGAVVVSSGSTPGNTDEEVSVLPAASTLVLLKKTGGDTQELNLTDVKANSSWVTQPKSVQLRFQNTGNTHVVPRGTVELMSPTGSVVSRGTINTDSSFVLPESFRRYEVPLKGMGSSWLPGRYKLVTTWRYDGQEQPTVVTQYHWYFGKVLLIIFGALSLLIVLKLYRNYRSWDVPLKK